MPNQKVLQCLEDFLVNENAGPMLQLQRNNPNYNLSKNQLNFVVRLLGEFTQQRFGNQPSPKQKEAVAKAFVELFPSVQMVNWPYELLYFFQIHHLTNASVLLCV